MPDPTATTRELLAHPAPLHASLSPDGQRLALTTTRVPAGTVDEVVEIRLIDVASGEAVRWGHPGDRCAEWAPDGERLALLAERDTRIGLATGSTTGDDVDVLEGTEGAAGPPRWSPDGRSLVVPARRGSQVDRTGPWRWTRGLAAADGTGPLEDPPQLLLVDVDTGERRWLTDDGWRWSTPRWSPDGTRLAAVVGQDPDDVLGGQVLRIVDLEGNVTEPLIPSGRSVVPAWLPDGGLAALVAEPGGRPAGSAAELFVLDDGRVRQVPVGGLFGDVFGDNPAELADICDAVLLAHGDALVVRVGARGRMGVARVDRVSGEAVALAAGDRCLSPVAAAGDRLVVTRQSATEYPDVAVMSVGPDATAVERPLVPRPPTSTGVEVQRFVTESDDGLRLDGWFLAPPGGAGPLPTVVVVHGGPHFTYGESFSIDAHALCAAGFGVLYTNPRGSTGYGDAFAHAVHGDWADGPSRDLMAVVGAAVDRGWVDRDRIGITGNSYGGYLAAWLATTTSDFRAAVIENPVTDLLGMYWTSDIGRRFFPAQLGGTPHESLSTYLAQSPLFRAAECRTPCLFVVGELDRRCPPAQAWSMHRSLRAQGTPSEVLVLPGSTHEGSTYGPVAGRLAHDEALVQWMTRWLLADG